MTLDVIAKVAHLEFQAHSNAATQLFDTGQLPQCVACFDESLQALERERAALLTMEALRG